jgi:cyclophilin family peptidyl-prolyl cis-trans isomerase
MKATKAILAAAVTLIAGSTLVVANHNDAARAADAGEDPVVLIETTKGPIKVKVFKKEAPITSNNFLDLVGRHFYDGLTFHRYEPGFVIQGGDPTGTGSGNFKDPKTHQDRLIKLEKVPTLKHDAPGMVAMARTSEPNSASCQFYITLKATPFLDEPPGYAVFGKVVDGMDNVMKLRAGDKMTKVKIEG